MSCQVWDEGAERYPRAHREGLVSTLPAHWTQCACSHPTLSFSFIRKFCSSISKGHLLLPQWEPPSVTQMTRRVHWLPCQPLSVLPPGWELLENLHQSHLPAQTLQCCPITLRPSHALPTSSGPVYPHTLLLLICSSHRGLHGPSTQ
jgi:hypothetical protein